MHTRIGEDSHSPPGISHPEIIQACLCVHAPLTLIHVFAAITIIMHPSHSTLSLNAVSDPYIHAVLLTGHTDLTLLLLMNQQRHLTLNAT